VRYRVVGYITFYFLASVMAPLSQECSLEVVSLIYVFNLVAFIWKVILGFLLHLDDRDASTKL